MIRKLLLIITAIFITACGNVNVQTTKNLSKENNLIPRKALFDNPDKVGVSISPDGKYISYLSPKNDVMNLWIADIDNVHNTQLITNSKKSGIAGYAWAYDNKHILYTQDNNGDENFCLYAYNLETKKTTLLPPKNGVKLGSYSRSLNKPNEILISLNERDKRYFDVYKLDLRDYSKELIIENNKFNSIIYDNNLSVRFAVYINENGEKEYFQFKDNIWIPFMKLNFEDGMTTGIIGFDKTNTKIYLNDSRGRDNTAIKLLDLSNGKLTTIAADKRTDTYTIAFHPTEGNIQIVATNYDKPVYKILDKSIRSDVKYLQSINSGKLVLNTRTIDDNIWLVYYYSDRAMPQHYLYNRSEKKAKFLFSGNPKLEHYTFSPMTPVIIKTRDGLDMMSYLTIPVEKMLQNKKLPAEPLPLIIHVHGGPHSRDSWGFNTTHQWLANRGYAVLSVNYRGSTGFGKKFLNAGNREWGKKMHYDIIDAARWSINNKIADPKKICIMGGSYGGYETLIGLTMNPDLFACGVDLVGISDLVSFLQSTPEYWKPVAGRLKMRIGDISTEEGRNQLRLVSPLTFADNISKPLFIAQGMNDPRVKKAQSDMIVESLERKNIPVIYALYKNEGHGLSKAENRLSFFAITELFLAKTLGGRAEPLESSLLYTHLVLNGNRNVTNEYIKKLVDYQD